MRALPKSCHGGHLARILGLRIIGPAHPVCQTEGRAQTPMGWLDTRVGYEHVMAIAHKLEWIRGCRRAQGHLWRAAPVNVLDRALLWSPVRQHCWGRPE